ncbi:hypothetical protein FACS1894125_5150 [Actinomycetota bacterium]|nr:hypothetical protein FACS1894125_5150 [Actinomycetota bacterium]
MFDDVKTVRKSSPKSTSKPEVEPEPEPKPATPKHKTIYLVTDGATRSESTKRGLAVKAEDSFTGVFAKGGRAYAMKNLKGNDKWFYFSTKYGLTKPDAIVEDYNIPLNGPNQISEPELRELSAKVI